MARIILSEHGVLKHTYYKLDGTLSIGSAEDNIVKLDHTDVSSRHAVIRAQQDDKGRVYFVLQDLDSQHGSFINSRRVKVHRLSHRDLIRIGPQQFIFYDHKDRYYSTS